MFYLNHYLKCQIRRQTQVSIFFCLEFIDIFTNNYSYVVPVLDFHQSTLSLLLCDLLSFFVTNHSFRAHYFILQTPITSKIIQLLRVKEKYLRLGEFLFV